MFKSSLFRQMLDPAVDVAEMDPRKAHISQIFPAEQAIVARSVTARQQEFAAGRILARKLLGDRGFLGPLHKTSAGPPAWPKGLTGSITHCLELAAVAVVSTKLFSGIGLDVEVRKPLDATLHDVILPHARERALAALDPDNGLWMFCAKEAAYKSVFSVINRPMGFEDLLIESEDNGKAFAAIFRIDIGLCRRGDVIYGKKHSTDRLIATVATMPPNACTERL